MSESDPNRRDDLALIRTDLANERTLLAYGRTSLMVAASGVTLIKFFPGTVIAASLGWSLVVASTCVASLGVIRFSRLQRRLRGPREG